MANEKLKFTSLEEAKEFLLKSKEENADVSQKQFLDAVSALNLDDDTMDDLYNWIDENMIEFIDGDELDEDDLNDVVKKIKDVLPLCQDLRRLGSASLDLCYVAKGTFDGYYEMNLKPWDVSAGVLILTEAGGIVSNISGGEYNLFEDKYIVATNGKIHDKLIEKLNI